MNEVVINDILLEFDDNKCYYDIKFDGVDLSGATNLVTAVIMALFSDGRSRNDDVIPNSRGWAGDSLNNEDEINIGSRLWLLQHRKITESLINDMEVYASDALRHLVDDGIAKEITVEALIVDAPKGIIRLNVFITDPNNTLQEFTYLWDQVRKKFRGE